MDKTVAIAGGGASGVLLAAHLLRKLTRTRVLLFDPGELGAGIAYSTRCPAHVLNVPATKMSAFPRDPAHFVTWLARRYPGRYDAASFVSRCVYGEYLSCIAEAFPKIHSNRFDHIKSFVSAADVIDGVRLHCDDGRSYHADILVLATGNAAPATWRNAPESNRFFGSAWQNGALVPEQPDEAVLILGSGLTAVDAVLGLRHNGHRGTFYLVSRRGLLPHEHRLFDAPPDVEPDVTSLRELVGSLSKRRNGHWRSSVDGVRTFANDAWKALTLSDRKRFLRHVAPYWNVHRHRMAPAAATAFAELIAAGTIQTIAGRTTHFTETDGALQVRIRERAGTERTIVARRAINCSGPEHDISKSENPLIRSLLSAGVLTPTDLNIGVNVGADGALINRSGTSSSRVYAIGPVCFGTLIETTAIPEISVQAMLLAATLAKRTTDRLRIEVTA